MSEFFKGKNNFKKLSNQFIYKTLFLRDAHINKGPEVFDFDIIEFQMYGAIDFIGSSIYPREDLLKKLPSPQERPDTPLAFDFVVDMFNDVKTNIEIAVVMGEVVIKNEILRKLEIKRAYESPRKLYLTSLANIMINFNDFIENNLTVLNNITTFNKYVKEFLSFLENNYANQPITFSGWIQSKMNSIFSTGLAVSIADIDFDDDDKKFSEFMTSNGFEYFKKICLNRGFRIHEHIPYILVADLDSPAFKPYSKYSNNIVSNTIDNYYDKCYTKDYLLIKNYIIEYYNILIERNPYMTSLELCSKRTLKKTVFRQSYNRNNPTISDFYWINYYLHVRNIELGHVKQKAEIKKIKRYLKNLQKKLDKEQMISYIDSNFRLETFNKPYGYYDMIRRQKELEQLKRQEEGITGGSITTGGTTSGGY